MFCMDYSLGELQPQIRYLCLLTDPDMWKDESSENAAVLR